MLKRILLTTLTLCTIPISVSHAAEMAVVAGQGIEFKQVDFPFDDSPLLDSAVGRMEANLYVLREQAGFPSGFLNLLVDGLWQVRNMPVPTEVDYPYPQLTSNFDLGINEGTDVTTLNATIVFSETLLTTAPSPNPSDFGVGSISVSQGGFGDSFGADSTGSAVSPPAMAGISFGDATNNRQAFQLDHPNIETAVNQCYPMAIANSLQFLEDTTKLNLPHSHVKGLRGDNSLVGQIGLAMNRNATSRTTGSGVNGLPGIQGKMKYLVDNNLQDQIQTRHWGLANNQNVSVSSGNKTATSTAQGNALNFDKLVEALEGGENCEAGYIHSRGGHFVDIVAAGYIAGQPFVIEASDIAQRDDTKGSGKNGLIFSHLKDTDNDGSLNMNGSTTELVAMICQKFIPPPPTDSSLMPPPAMEYFIPGAALKVTKVDDPAGHSCCTTPPPSSVNLTIANGTFTLQALTNTISWLPLIGVIDALLELNAAGSSTVADLPNTSTSFSGTLSADKITADIALGTGGELPGGVPITYTVEITPDGGWPWLVDSMSTSLRVNGVRGTHTVAAGEAISISVGVDSGVTTGDGEWFLAAQIGEAVGSLDIATGMWKTGLSPSRVAAIETVSNENVFTLTSGLPAGEYTFYFGIDNNVNGTVDADTLALDSFVLTVE